MKYNFDEVIDRTSTDSMKWDSVTLKEMFGVEDALPFWVADMDFKVANPIIETIRERVDHGIYGYTERPDSYYNSIINWTKRRFDWDIQKEWIEYTPGVVPALNYLIQALCIPGDKIVIQEPVYYPFKNSILNNGCHVVDNPLIENEDYYDIDFEDLEVKLKDPKVTMFIFCSPHNPVSRVWSEEELRKIGNLCLENDVVLVSDEIHNDLVYSGFKHTMIAGLEEKFAMNSITLTAPSKTFNLAGMQASNVIIPNIKIREKFQRVLERNSISLANPFSIVALEAAYNKGEEWLEQLLEYLEGNIKLINEYITEHLPKAKVIEVQATYLAWIDLRAYETDGEKLEKAIIEEKVALDGGSWFGEGGEGFMRLNFACPRSLLQEGLKRLCTAINNIE